nr:hypothetical protein [Tanacetum cinerariifolium]
MTSQDKKITITPKPKLPSPSSSLISQNRFIALSPYSSYGPRPRPTYSTLDHMPSMSQSLNPYNRLPSTASSSSNITRSLSDKPQFQYSVKWWKQIDEGQADIKAVSEYHNSLIRKTPSISTTRTSITDVDAIERIQAAGSSKEEIQKILNEVRRSPASNTAFISAWPSSICFHYFTLYCRNNSGGEVPDLVILDKDEDVDGDLL